MTVPRCQAVPGADQSIALCVDGQVRTAWRFPEFAPRPFLYPVYGPEGTALTRMGHPGAPNHDHHRSVWFAHHQVLGIDFWSDTGTARIRQTGWLAMQDGEDETAIAVELAWSDGHDPAPLLTQQAIIALRPGVADPEESELEITTTLTPTAEQLELGRTNFGLLAVRVAAGISERFGNGQLSDSEGRRHEKAIFEQAARWVDYSGVVRNRAGKHVKAGLTYFDHPKNPDHPARWHVRADGWMGASLCGRQSLVLSKQAPLTVRYLLHLHRGTRQHADAVAKRFAESAALRVRKSSQSHVAWEITRVR